uniref:Secreted protein n=1 Tax=Ixodes ricinus TaxID=34613 RepID=A0A6B0UXN7_IXORI
MTCLEVFVSCCAVALFLQSARMGRPMIRRDLLCLMSCPSRVTWMLSTSVLLRRMLTTRSSIFFGEQNSPQLLAYQFAVSAASLSVSCGPPGESVPVYKITSSAYRARLKFSIVPNCSGKPRRTMLNGSGWITEPWGVFLHPWVMGVLEVTSTILSMALRLERKSTM